MIKQAIVHWDLNDVCSYNCEYCPGRFRHGTNVRSVEEYLAIVSKLQTTRYKHAQSVKWILGGGEPLEFSGLNLILREIKNQPSWIRLDTSGGDSWFNLMEVGQYLDKIRLTHHEWQNASVLDFIIDYCQENKKELDIFIPLLPGKIREGKAKVEELKSQGIAAYEQVLNHNGYKGQTYPGYSWQDKNLIAGRPEDWVPPPIITTAAPEPVVTTAPIPTVDPAYVDLTKKPEDSSPKLTGLPCYAGVDYIYIDQRGFAKGSECGGRDIGNVFDDNWQAPADSFGCPMFWCRSENDRRLIRTASQ